MRALAGAEEPAGLGIEVSAPLYEFGNAEGPFGDENFGRGSVDDAIAGVYGVFEMESNVFVAFHGDSDSALCIVGIGFAERLFGDDQDFAVAS